MIAHKRQTLTLEIWHNPSLECICHISTTIYTHTLPTLPPSWVISIFCSLVMGTRSGDIDPSIPLHLMKLARTILGQRLRAYGKTCNAGIPIYSHHPLPPHLGRLLLSFHFCSLVMGTRSGDIDPSIPLHLMKLLGMSPAEMDNTLNKKSGLLGVCGQNDLRSVIELKVGFGVYSRV